MGIYKTKAAKTKIGNPSIVGQSSLEGVVTFLGIIFPAIYFGLTGLQHMSLYFIGYKVAQTAAREYSYASCDLPSRYNLKHRLRAHHFLSKIPGFKKIDLNHNLTAEQCAVSLKIHYKIPFIQHFRIMKFSENHPVGTTIRVSATE